MGYKIQSKKEKKNKKKGKRDIDPKVKKAINSK